MLTAAGLRAPDFNAPVGAVTADCRLPALNAHPHRQLQPALASVNAAPSHLPPSIKERAGSRQSADPLRQARGSTIGRKRLPLAWEIVMRSQLVTTLSGSGAVA